MSMASSLPITDRLTSQTSSSKPSSSTLPPPPHSLPSKPSTTANVIPNTLWVSPGQTISSKTAFEAAGLPLKPSAASTSAPLNRPTAAWSHAPVTMGTQPSPASSKYSPASFTSPHKQTAFEGAPSTKSLNQRAITPASTSSSPMMSNQATVQSKPSGQSFLMPPKCTTSTSPREHPSSVQSIVSPTDQMSSSENDSSMPPPSMTRKRKEVETNDSTANEEEEDRTRSEASVAPSSAFCSKRLIKREPSTTPGLEGSGPIPILPLPLPSKRFKKTPGSKAVLIPVEQLPVFPLPPLPVIEDEILLKQVFTHQSNFPRTRGRFEDPEDDPAMHYEKLEHVGDSILGMIVTTWLHESKPLLTCGSATRLKAHMVSNATLSHISGLYNMPQRLVGDPQLLPVLRAQTDVRAALVEAYIAALYFSFPLQKRMTEGLQIIDGWLREMYEPLFDFFLNYMKAEWDQHRTAIGENPDGTVQTISPQEMARIDQAAMGMAPLLSMYATRQERDLQWEEERLFTNMGYLWRIKCTVDGIELGEATRASKKMARNVAAWEGAKKLGLAVGSVT